MIDGERSWEIPGNISSVDTEQFIMHGVFDEKISRK